jgi:hypothetical protein
MSISRTDRALAGGTLVVEARRMEGQLDAAMIAVHELKAENVELRQTIEMVRGDSDMLARLTITQREQLRKRGVDCSKCTAKKTLNEIALCGCGKQSDGSLIARARFALNVPDGN